MATQTVLKVTWGSGLTSLPSECQAQHYPEEPGAMASTSTEYRHSTKQSCPPPPPPTPTFSPGQGQRLDWGSHGHSPGSRSHPQRGARGRDIIIIREHRYISQILRFTGNNRVSGWWWKLRHHSSIEFLLCVHCDRDLAAAVRPGMALATDNIFMHYKLSGPGPRLQTNRRCLKGRTNIDTSVCQHEYPPQDKGTSK